MYRLSLKLFLVLAFVAGPVLGFAPDASAHKNTNTVAAVVGNVGWPELPKHGGIGIDGLVDRAGLTCLEGEAACADASFDLDRTPGGTDLSLDIRASAGLAVNLLNGCRKKGGNTTHGLPLGGDNGDQCFAFTDLVITATGVLEGRLHVTDFACESSGTSAATGSTPNGGPVVAQKRLGAFYGEFVCDGPGPTGVVPSADGHFHGLSKHSTIAFLGEVHCTVANADGVACPPDYAVPDPVLDDSRIKHTLACKGSVVDVRGIEKPEDDAPGGPPDHPAPGPTIHKAQVRLECVIA